MSAPARYVYATLRAFASDTSTGARDRVLILGSNGSEISWDGDRIHVVEPGAHAATPRDRISAYVEAALASRDILQTA